MKKKNVEYASVYLLTLVSYPSSHEKGMSRRDEVEGKILVLCLDLKSSTLFHKKKKMATM